MRKTQAYKIVPDANYGKIPAKKITSSREARNYMAQFYFEDIAVYESFFLALVNQQNNTVGYVKISQGGVAGTTVDVRIIAKYAIDCLASGVLICHNHPSGSLYPSKEDIDVTKKIKNSLALFNINLLDHIILIPDEEGRVSDKYYSFADEGQLFLL